MRGMSGLALGTMSRLDGEHQAGVEAGRDHLKGAWDSRNPSQPSSQPSALLVYRSLSRESTLNLAGVELFPGFSTDS
ncbi:hypothetical protein GX51_06240 [Blastomyces parvus]|uniref:Uncharacterized protein n=1 Tax=Blastomyces parvus TaxID=2060905 RepID=A0A2B7WSY0_9EURO|nr:hypothetical protein GX51_06240 [Blastomyces parvus]